MTGLRGRASLIGGALIIAAGLGIPVVTATSAPATTVTPTTTGIDVSSLQHPTNTSVINWPDVAAAGNVFTGIKASEATYYVNPFFVQDAEQAAQATLYVMPYAFANPFNPGVNGTAQAQADKAAAQISLATTVPASQWLPLVLDIEYDPYAGSQGTNECYGYTPSAMVTWIGQFLTEAQLKTGKKPIIYTTADWWQACTGNSNAFGTYPLWIANYGVSVPSLPAGWTNYTFWQYSSVGAIPGVPGSDTDHDYFGSGRLVDQVARPMVPVQLQTLTSLNGTGPAVTYTSTTLPPGVSLSSTGQLTGTPSTPGQYTVTVTPSAGAVPSSMTFTWNVYGPITVNSPGSRTTTAGTPVWLHVLASDPNPGYTPSLAVTGLPTGLTMNSIGVISGWPSRPGTFTVRVSASDAFGAVGSMSFTWTVKPAADTGFTGAIQQAGGSAKCLDDPAGKTANGTLVDMWSCTAGHTNQQWTVVQDGTIRVLGKCLDVVNEGTANGTKLQLWTCNSADGGQLWQAGTDGQLVNPQSGKCIDVAVSSAANGTHPVLWTCANLATQPNEHWLRPAASVYSGDPGKCLGVVGSTAYLLTCANTAVQHWVAQSNGTIRVGKNCLTEKGVTSGSGVSIGPCSGTAATWKLVAAGPIATELVNAASGLCVTAPSSAAGTKLTVGACAATPATTWHVE